MKNPFTYVIVSLFFKSNLSTIQSDNSVQKNLRQTDISPWVYESIKNFVKKIVHRDLEWDTIRVIIGSGEVLRVLYKDDGVPGDPC